MGGTALDETANQPPNITRIMTVRPFDPADRDGLWQLKRAFERELGTETGGPDKANVYEAKLTDEYRGRYLSWVETCVAADNRAVTVAAEAPLKGYVFILPERFAMIWDAAVINEFFVDPDYRGTGIADDLMAAALEAAGEQSLPLDRIVLDVSPDNDRARAFYTRHGFEPWGELIVRAL